MCQLFREMGLPVGTYRNTENVQELVILYGVPGVPLRFVFVQVFVFSHSIDGDVEYLGYSGERQTHRKC